MSFFDSCLLFYFCKVSFYYPWICFHLVLILFQATLGETLISQMVGYKTAK